MSYNPLRDAKFWTLLIDALVSLALYFLGKYASPSTFEDAKILIGAVQPIFLALVIGFLQRDQTQLRESDKPLPFLSEK